MDVNFTEEQEMLRSSARDFLEKECTEDIIAEVEAGRLGYSPDLWNKITELGWLGLVFPEQYDGSEMNLVDLAVLYEEFGRASFASPYTSTIVLGGLTILEVGSNGQKSDILPKMIEGEVIIAAAIGASDPGLEGTELRPDDVTISATADGEDFLLNGGRLFIHNASIADYFLVPARTNSGNDAQDGITLFLVDANSPGLNITQLTTIPGDNQCEVIFDNIRASADTILGELDNGWAPLSRSLQIAEVMMASQMLGAGERLYRDSEEDFMTRLESGIPDDIKQHNEEYLANLKKDIDTCRRITYDAAKKLVEGESFDFEGSITRNWSLYTHQNA
ncbi:MAG: acyl-CoA/acyl-ACP dehydrogenase [Dehalococcoidales bacterium]|nr:MAG: acyl-CoA/acyl-ACP dehydrogenase [Dehalococcoidales bacterium]